MKKKSVLQHKNKHKGSKRKMFTPLRIILMVVCGVIVVVIAIAVLPNLNFSTMMSNEMMSSEMMSSEMMSNEMMSNEMMSNDKSQQSGGAGVDLQTATEQENSTPILLNTEQVTQIKTALRSEFEGAYSELLEPSNSITHVQLTALSSEIELFDGVKTKAWSYNGTVPGPIIRLPLGDTLKIEFQNNLPQETTIHFHGIRVPNAFDGVPGVTQPPIAVGGTFTYEFTPKDSGTFWYHPHFNSSEQIERGLYGVIVVEDAYSKQYSQDVVWVLDDWLLRKNSQINPNFLTRHELAHDGRWGNVITVNGKQQTDLQAQPGERVRLRLVNTSNGRVYKLSFGGLTAMAIAVDGLTVKEPFNAHAFELAPGNRIDVDITIPAGISDRTYAIRDYFASQFNMLATIVVSGEEVTTPQFPYPVNPNIPDWEQAHAIPSDAKFLLNFQGGMMRGIEWTINGRAYPEYSPFTLNYNTFHKISYVNNSARLHPMHIHGQFFKVLSRNGVRVDENFFRDTVLVHGRETVEIGIIPLDSGRWALHCHILEHSDSGMMAIIDVL